MNIGTQEISDLEVVGALIRMHLTPQKKVLAEAEADPLVAVTGGGNLNLYDPAGNAWTANYLKISGELDVDLRSNIAAEARAKTTYERLMHLTDDQGTKQALQFLMTREITHLKALTAALDSLGTNPFSIGQLPPTPGIVDQLYNASTCSGDLGDDGLGKWIHQNGLQVADTVSFVHSIVNSEPANTRAAQHSSSLPLEAALVTA